MLKKDMFVNGRIEISVDADKAGQYENGIYYVKSVESFLNIHAASLAAGASPVMAAVMAGGMVPPLALSLSMLLFKNKYTAKDRQSILTNFIMGISFITEGAIPFAAADSLRVIPASIIGSSITGLLSMAFDCSIRAPHGGIWVIGVVQNPLMYFVAILFGSVVAATILGLLKKKVEA